MEATDNLARPVYRVSTVEYPPLVIYNSTSQSYSGYTIDLLDEVAKIVGFNYTVSQPADKQMGDLDSIKGWTGIINEMVLNKSDIAATAMWITRTRGTVVDFTLPYYEQNGISVMMRRRRKEIPFLRFLQILEIEVWISFALAFFLTTVLIYFFERFSPVSYRNNPENYEDEPDERFKFLKECFWFTATSITPEGGGDTPKNFSGKLCAATWWLFGFIIVAAYTANLAAYQTLTRLEKEIKSLDDLVRQYQVEYTTIQYSPTYWYFHIMEGAEQIFYTIWRDMTLLQKKSEWERSQFTVWDYPLDAYYSKIQNAIVLTGYLANADAVLNRFKNQSLRDFAYIGETTLIKYFMLTNCGFKMLHEEFAKKSYGFALRRKLGLKDQMDKALLELEEKGVFDKLKKKWWDDNPLRVTCPVEREFNTGMGLDNFGAIFLLIIIGIIATVLIIIVEFIWCFHLRKHSDKVMKKILRKFKFGQIEEIPSELVRHVTPVTNKKIPLFKTLFTSSLNVPN